MPFNTPVQTFSNAENFVETILQDAKKFQEDFKNFEYTKEEKDFLISEMEKYSDKTVGTAELGQMLGNLMAQKFDENRKNILWALIATRIRPAINEKQIQKTTTNVQNNVNELL